MIVTSEQLYRWHCAFEGKVPRSTPGHTSHRLVGEELRELYLRALAEESRSEEARLGPRDADAVLEIGS